MRALLALFAVTLLPTTAFAGDHGHAPAPAGPTGWENYSALQTGNMRFYEGHLAHPHQELARREQLASGQKPHSIVVSCSDSRVPPETIFDQGLGDLFVVRVAGNVVNPEAIASIEYALEHLGSKLLVVMGHESCGAVGAAIASRSGVSNGSESLDHLVRHIRGGLSAGAVASAESDKTFRATVKENVAATMRELVQKSEITRRAVLEKGLILAQGIYSLKTGRVEFWDVGTKMDLGANSSEAPMIQEAKVASESIPAATVGKKKKAKAHATPAAAPAHAPPAAHDSHDHH